MRRYKQYSLILLLVLGVHTLGVAQPSDPGSGEKPGVPISGIEILIGLGVLWGARKVYAGNKRNINKDS